ncbi:MAG: SsrA-binding protein SmpB [Candidatus Paceibacterota bacterium]
MALVSNKKVYFDFEIIEKIEAGIELLGFEVKSLKGGHGSLAGSYVIIRGGEAFLVGATIPPYQAGNTPSGYDEARPRKLLLNKREIDELVGAEKGKGLTLVPLSLYNKGGKIKIEIAVARGKKKHDKREAIKKRDTERDIGRTLKNR